MDQPVLQRASPVLSGVPPCRTAWGAREQHKPANMVRHWTERCGNSAACLLSGWVASQPEVCYNATMLSGTCCNALRVLQERWHPAMSWTVLQSVSLANLLFERYTTTALVLWQMQRQFLDASFFCMLLSFADTTKYVADWDHTTDGCISPMKLGACSPVSFVVGDGMLGSRSLAFFASSLSSLVPPLRGVLTSFNNWICDRSWQSRGWLLRPWRPMMSWPERTLREIS